MSARTVITLSWCVSVASLLVTACAAVDPKPDYQRASHLVAERTGTGEAYDPSTDEQVADKVAALLSDGLTVDEAVRLALLNSPSLQSVFQEIGVSRADVVQAGLLTNPSFSFLAQVPEGGGLAKLTLGFSQNIVDLWQIPIRRKIAKAELEQAILRVVQQAVELAADTKTQVYRLFALQQAELIANEHVGLVDKSLKLAQDRLAAGDTGLLDVNLVRTDLLAARIRLIDIRRQRRLAEISLSNTLGLSRRTEPWTVRGDLPSPVSLPRNESDLLMFAMTERLDARIAALKVQAADDQLRREYLNIFPDVSVGVDWERPDQRALPGRKLLADTARESIAGGKPTAPAIQSRAQRDAERRSVINSLIGPSLQITLPIWDQNQAQIAKARFIAEQRRKDYEALLDAVARQVQDALVIIQSAEQQLTFYREEILPLATTNVEAAYQTYQAGDKDILVLIDAEKGLISQRQACLEVTRDYAVGLAELERTLGGRLPAAPVTQPAETTPALRQGDSSPP